MHLKVFGYSWANFCEDFARSSELQFAAVVATGFIILIIYSWIFPAKDKRDE